MLEKEMNCKVDLIYLDYATGSTFFSFFFLVETAGVKEWYGYSQLSNLALQSLKPWWEWQKLGGKICYKARKVEITIQCPRDHEVK